MEKDVPRSKPLVLYADIGERHALALKFAESALDLRLGPNVKGPLGTQEDVVHMYDEYSCEPPSV